jgi:hypothetical protein
MGGTYSTHWEYDKGTQIFAGKPKWKMSLGRMRADETIKLRSY